MSELLNGHQQGRHPIDEDDTDQFDFDKKSWRTIAFVLVLLAATGVMIVALA